MIERILIVTSMVLQTLSGFVLIGIIIYFLMGVYGEKEHKLRPAFNYILICTFIFLYTSGIVYYFDEVVK